MNTTTTGKIIRTLRVTRGLSQEEFGRILGVKKSTVQKYENDSIQNLKLEIMRAICSKFNLPPYFVIFPEYVKPEDVYNIKNVDNNMQCLMQDVELIQAIISLNELGRNKLTEYVFDIVKIKEYTEQKN